MEKTEGKIRYGLIGIGAQGGSYARFLTNAPAPFPGMVCAPCPDNCALGALCDIDPEKEKMCKEQYPDVPFFKDWKDMIASGTVDAIITTVPHYPLPIYRLNELKEEEQRNGQLKIEN